MGRSYSIRCKNCEYSKDFKVGVGFMYCPAYVIDIDSKPALLPDLIQSKKAISQITSLIKEKKAELADNYGHKIYRCSKCGEFFERFFIHLDYEGVVLKLITNAPPARPY